MGPVLRTTRWRWDVSAVGLCLVAACGGPSSALKLAMAPGQTPDFGLVPTNASASRNCVVSNIGDGPAKVGKISFREGTSVDFSVQSDGCAFDARHGLPAGATCSFTVAFSPSAEGPAIATVVLAGTDGDMPSLDFKGSGAPPMPITEYPIPTANAGPLAIGPGSDGALWFAENGARQIGRITTAGAFTEYPLQIANVGLIAVAPDPNGALWFVDGNIDQVVQVSVDGKITAHATPTLNDLKGIALGPDNSLWISAYGGTIGRMSTAGVVTATFAIPTLDAGAGPIAAGPARTLWFTEYHTERIARVDLDGSITEFTMPAAAADPVAITAGPDGRVWFVDSGAIGAITPLGVVSMTVAPDAGGAESTIAAGPDGALWFTEPNSNRIGRISTSGEVLELRLPTPGAFPTSLAVGADGAIWFTESFANQVGRVAPNAL